ncbi:MAG: AraC family transcriptional regulator, partial [Bacteroidales bacterium]
EKLEHKSETFNSLLFVSDGEIQFRDNTTIKTVKPNEFIVIPNGVSIDIDFLRDSLVLVVYFDITYLIGNPQINSRLKHIEPQELFICNPTSVKNTLRIFLKGIHEYLKHKGIHSSVYPHKLTELLLLICFSYEAKELQEIFGCLKISSFQRNVYGNYKGIRTVGELSEKLNMSKHTFSKQFNDEFGISPAKWLSQQLAKDIIRKISNSNILAKDLMYEFNFSSATDFTRFCKRHYGQTPSELIKQLQGKNHKDDFN